MGRSSELFMEMRASKMSPDEFFHWLTSQEEAEDAMLNIQPTLQDLDNLFTCADEDND